MKYHEATGFQVRCILHRGSRGSCDEFDSLVNDELNDIGIPDKRLGDIDAKRFVGQIPHFFDLNLDRIQFTGRSLDDSHATRIADRGGKLRACNPAHGSLNDG